MKLHVTGRATALLQLSSQRYSILVVLPCTLCLGTFDVTYKQSARRVTRACMVEDVSLRQTLRGIVIIESRLLQLSPALAMPHDDRECALYVRRSPT
jgi:hypothetical protein